MPPLLLRRAISAGLLLALALAPSACRQKSQGVIKVVVIGGEPQLKDPATAELGPADQLLAANVAQGLVRIDASGQIVPGLAERWAVSDDGLSYIFRIASADWPDGRRITAEQVARLLKRQLTARSSNPLKGSLGAVDDIVAMTDRVIEIRLNAPRPNLLSLLAEPAFAIVRDGEGTGPFTIAKEKGEKGSVTLEREVVSLDDEQNRRERLLLGGASAAAAIQAFAAGRADLVLGGTFVDLPLVRDVNLPRNSLRFDPASGLFGLQPTHAGGPLDKPEVRQLLSQAIDRDAFVAALNVPGLAARATVLEPGLEGMPDPAPPAWTATALADRQTALVAEATRLFGTGQRPTIRVDLPQGPGADVLLTELNRDWGPLGLTVERAPSAGDSDLRLIDAVAPSDSPAWFLRQFRCDAAPICAPEADALLDAARNTVVPAQRYALFVQAAALIDSAQLFLPIAAPVRWSLVGPRIEGFAGNRTARHTLTELEQKPGAEGP